jgi:hypothetical protein
MMTAALIVDYAFLIRNVWEETIWPSKHAFGIPLRSAVSSQLRLLQLRRLKRARLEDHVADSIGTAVSHASVLVRRSSPAEETVRLATQTNRSGDFVIQLRRVAMTFS